MPSSGIVICASQTTSTKILFASFLVWIVTTTDRRLDQMENLV